MNFRPLGGTGMMVSPYCLGAMMFGPWGNTDEKECREMVAAALEAGINFFDTADIYSAGQSERILGEALAGRRGEVILATKFHGSMGPLPNQRGNSRRWIIQACEASLRRLGTDWIDLYQIHRLDMATDIDETLGALSNLIDQGKIRAAGCSTFPAHALVDAQWVARTRGRERLWSEQPPYSIFVRSPEEALLPVCEQFNMGVLAWSPLNGGWLSGRYRLNQPFPNTGRAAAHPEWFRPDAPSTQAKLKLVEQLLDLAEAAGISLIELSLRFVLSHRAVTSAILGPRTSTQLATLLSCPTQPLPSDLLDRIDDLVAPGTDVEPSDRGWRHPALTDPARRRAHC